MNRWLREWPTGLVMIWLRASHHLVSSSNFCQSKSWRVQCGTEFCETLTAASYATAPTRVRLDHLPILFYLIDITEPGELDRYCDQPPGCKIEESRIRVPAGAKNYSPLLHEDWIWSSSRLHQWALRVLYLEAKLQSADVITRVAITSPPANIFIKVKVKVKLSL
jgi:hypothetical protein